MRARHRSSADKVHHFLAHAIKLQEIDGSERYTVVCHDINDTYELEIQKRVLSQFCHEARNKYAAAAAVLEQILFLIATPTTSPPAGLAADVVAMEDDISMAIAQLEEADMLVQTRLDLHKLYSGRYDTEQHTQTVDCDALLRFRADAAAALASKGVAFAVDIPTLYATATIRLDTYVWTHIASNLLSNARKHVKSGSVSIRFLGDDDDTGMLSFAVADTGCGVRPDIVARLFDEEVSTGVERGVGLGLVSCRTFARAIGGDCWLHDTKVATADEPDGFTDFRFKLPGRVVLLAPSPTCADAQTSLASGRIVAAAGFARSDVYIIEDSDLIRKTSVSKFAKLASVWAVAWTFHEYPTIEAFLHLVPTLVDRPDVILCVDENLHSAGGNLTGTDLIKRLAALRFPGCLVSVSGDPSVSQLHLDLGATCALGKPLPTLSKLADRLLASILKRNPAADAHPPPAT